MSQELPTRLTCGGCRTQLGEELLACPVCGRLVHAQRLTELAGMAKAAAEGGDPIGAIQMWREALELLPPDSKQTALIARKIAALSNKPIGVPSPRAGSSSRAGKMAAGMTGVALLLWKLKFILVFVLTKGKMLLLGLTKGGTFVTMFLSFAVYWTAWGWAFAAGLVISIYIHEMGHVEALRRYGFKASAPMFIPGLGALIRLKQRPVNAAENARIGLAGPIWGLAAAAAAWGVWMATGKPIWGAMAHVGAWINLFNLVPIWQLDGGRGFAALSRQQGWAIVLVAGIVFFWTGEGMVLLMVLAGVFQAMAKRAEAKGDQPVMVMYAALIVALAALSGVRVPMALG